MSIAISGSSITFPDQTQMSTATGGSFRNRIFNGDMRIDQRNAGAAITAQGYPVDRFQVAWTMDGAVSCQRSTTAPSGYRNSLAISVTSQDTSIGASQAFQIFQKIEGNNISDLMLGTSDAKTMALSFWVNSSKTGIYCCTFANGAANRLLPVQYTINNANTWEQKTITISGDISGTWLSDNGLGLYVIWNLALGSNFNAGTNNTWNTTQYGTSNQVNFLDTNGATFYITGVQLEQGSTATEFERRPIGTELALCQRYYYELPSGSANAFLLPGGMQTSANTLCPVSHPVDMRIGPTLGRAGVASDYYVIINSTTVNCSSLPVAATASSPRSIGISFPMGASVGYASWGSSRTATAKLSFDSEL